MCILKTFYCIATFKKKLPSIFKIHLCKTAWNVVVIYTRSVLFLSLFLFSLIFLAYSQLVKKHDVLIYVLIHIKFFCAYINISIVPIDLWISLIQNFPLFIYTRSCPRIRLKILKNKRELIGSTTENQMRLGGLSLRQGRSATSILVTDSSRETPLLTFLKPTLKNWKLRSINERICGGIEQNSKIAPDHLTDI